MLGPMRQHDEHEQLQAALVPARIKLLVEAGVRPWRVMNVENRRIRNCHYRSPQEPGSFQNVTTITSWPPRVNNGIILAALEMKVGLEKNKLPVGIVRINRRNHALAPGMAVIKSSPERPGHLVVGAEVPDVGQAAVAVVGAARVAEGGGLKRAPAGIPEIVRVRQPQRVHFAAKRELRSRTQIQAAV